MDVLKDQDESEQEGKSDVKFPSDGWLLLLSLLSLNQQ